MILSLKLKGEYFLLIKEKLKQLVKGRRELFNVSKRTGFVW